MVGACVGVQPAGTKNEKARIEESGRGKVVPADVIRAAARGTDRLELVEYPWEALGMDSPNKGKKYVVVTDRAEIAQFLAAIQTPTLPLSSVRTHMCLGSPPIRLYRGDLLLAQFSIDHGVFLRPLSANLWGNEDVRVTRESAFAMAAWFERHGYAEFRAQAEHELAACAGDRVCPPW